MQKRWWIRMLLIGSVLGLIAAACGDGEEAAPPEELIPIRLQMQWIKQSQFAGYIAAIEQGFYADEGLDVAILESGGDIIPQVVVANGEAEFGLAWVPKALLSNEEGTGLVNIAQVFQRSGTLQVSFADSGISSPADFRGRPTGTWGFGNEHELYAAIRAEGMEPDVDVPIVVQGFNMLQLLPPEAGGSAEVDAAQAMTYNEYAQLLETINPDTGQLYLPEDFTVINFNDVGTAMLQDAVWVREAWLNEGNNMDISERFLRASFRGWIFCRDNFDPCVENVLASGTELGRSHMQWQLNEINDLIWPSPLGIGVMDPALWQQTVTIAVDLGVIQNVPSDSTYRTDIAQSALGGLSDLDTSGNSFQKRTDIVLVEGGA